MGTDLRIVQRITKIVNDIGGTFVSSDGMDLLINLRHAGALGQADVKRQRSLHRKPDFDGLRQIHAALQWGESVDKLGIINLDGVRMLYTKPLSSITDDDEPPAATTVDPSLFKPLSGYTKECDPSVFKHTSGRQYQQYIASME